MNSTAPHSGRVHVHISSFYPMGALVRVEIATSMYFKEILKCITCGYVNFDVRIAITSKPKIKFSPNFSASPLLLSVPLYFFNKCWQETRDAVNAQQAAYF